MVYTAVTIITVILLIGGPIFLIATGIGVFCDDLFYSLKEKIICRGIWVIILCFWLFIFLFFAFKTDYWSKTITITKDNQTNKIVYDGNYSITSDDGSFTVTYYKDGQYYKNFYGEGYNYVVEMK